MKFVIFTALVGLLGVSSVSAVAEPGPKAVNPYNWHTLTVEGRGAVDIITNQLRVQMTISRTNDCTGMEEDDPECDGGALQQQVNDVTSKLVQTMAKKDGVVSISSGGVSLSPQYNYNDTLQKSVFTGFQSSIQLSAIVDGDIMGEFLDEAVTMGVNNIGGIEYFIPDDTMKASQEEALKLASEDAMAQATAVLDVLGAEVKQIKSVNVPYLNWPFKDNGPADLDTGSSLNSSSLSSAVKTVGYVVKLRLKF